MRYSKWLAFRVSIAVVAMSGALVAPLGANVASAAAPPTLNLNVLLIGGATTAAWQSALTSEGVAYTTVTPAGAYGSETMTLPALSTGTTGNFDAVVFADSPFAFASGQLTSLYTYESQFQIRQIDGYSFPSPSLGETDVTSSSIASTTGALTAAGLAALPALKGPVPFDVGTLGYGATINAGAPVTSWMTSAAGNVLAGVYQHPSGDPQSGVAELSLNFDYIPTSLEWLLLSPGLINWVTQSNHVGLYRNYFGQDIDDNFIADNEWSSKYQCTPAATDPIDFTCPAGVAGTPADEPPDVQMSAADVAYVVAWEAQTGITLNMAFNGVGACSAPSVAAESNAKCTGSITENGTTYTLPGVAVDATNPNDQGLINALLADQKDFNWTTHTWSHEFLGCIVWQQQPITSATAKSGGSLAQATYDYEVTAATAYGESEPSVAKAVTPLTFLGQKEVTITWPNATNGSGAAGAGPTLSQEEASHSGGSGFWGYNVYRKTSTGTTYGYIGHVAEDPTGAATTYSFTDLGTVTPGVAPDASTTDPTATNPGIDCSSAANSWDPANDPSGQTDASIDTEIAWDQEWAAANGLTNYSPSVVITGEHSGVENPNMPAALHNVGVTVFASDASRQPQQYALTSGGTTAESAPRYPSNIYYNASNWADEINEYNTLYDAPGVSLGNSTYPTETGHCASSSSTTCLTTPATEASILASESSIMLSHVLANNPRVGYAHQTNLIGPAATGYTILGLISNMLTQYNAWTNTPLTPMNDVTEASTLQLQAAWAAAQTAKSVTATYNNGVVTITNTSGAPVSVPFTAPAGSTVGGTAYGQSYGGALSTWTTVAAHGVLTINEKVAPTITSANSATSIVGTPFTYTAYTNGAPTPALSVTGSLPTGINFTDNGNGTATIAGTAAAGTGGTFPITITATSSAGTATQTFTLTNAQAPTITSPATAQFFTGTVGTYTVTTTGFPLPTITETGALPSPMTFKDNGNGTATITGTPAANTAGSYPITLSATNSSGSIATLKLTITVSTASAPAITSANSFNFISGTSGSVVVTTTGFPAPALTFTGTLPTGINFTDNKNGTALIAGSSTQVGAFPIVVTANNGVVPNATQTVTINVGSAPVISSTPPPAATVGALYNFKVTTTGFPAPTLGITVGSLPPGLTFTDNHDGTATIAGTPLAGYQVNSPFAFTVSAANYVATTTQAFSLVLNASTITQLAPTSDTTTVDLSSIYTNQLNVSGNNGAANFTATTGSTANILVGFSGKVSTSGFLKAGLYTVSGTDVDGNGDKGTWTFSLTVTSGTITQAAPTAGSTTVATSAAFTAALAPALHDGSAVTFVTSATNAHLAVSAAGAISTVGAPLAAGKYTVSGTDSDSLGNAGTWTYTLTVTPSTISQIGLMSNSTNVDGSIQVNNALSTTGNFGGATTFTSTSGDTTHLLVSPAGVVTSSGYLKVGTYTVGGSLSDPDGDTGTWTFTLTITASVIGQGGPYGNSVAVDSSTGFTDQLTPGTHDGSAVLFATTVTNTNVVVSSTGAVSVSGAPLAAKTYTVSGTDLDATGSSGTWTYTLTVTPSVINQIAPLAGTVAVNGSSSFGAQLAPTTHDGSVISYVVTVPNANLKVSTTGAVTTAGGSLAVNTYVVSGTDSDALGDTGSWTYTLTVTKSIITQTTPTTGTVAVDGSSTFTGQLMPTTNNGATVTYVTTTPNTNVVVSASGAIITEGGTLPVNTYTVSGTDSDALGDTGIWTYTLTVTPSTISQSSFVSNATNVDGSIQVSDALGSSGNNGGPTVFAATTGDTTDLKISTAGLLTSNGYMKVGVYTISGTLSDPDGDIGTWTFTLTITPSTLSQTAPTSGTTTVDKSKTFSDQLTPASHDGAVITYTTTTSNPGLKVSSAGAVTSSGAYLAATTYTVTGTATDTLGDTGTWTYTLTVTPSTITQSAPTAGTVTVDKSPSFTDQLTPPTDNGSTVTYVTTSSNANLKVSSTGAVSVVNGPLAASKFTVSGTDSDALGDTGIWTYTLTVTPSTITQTAPTTGTTSVDGSSSFTDQLTPRTDNGSTVTYVTTSSNPNITVSSSGALSVTGGTLPVNSYAVYGTDSDTLGDTGTWTYTLTVTPSTISQSSFVSNTTNVDGSIQVSDALASSGNNGGPTVFTATSGDTTDLKITPVGLLTSVGYLKVGIYTLSGTLSDPYGDTGTWTFTLTITASAIAQTSPLTGSTTVDASPTFTDALSPLTNHGATVTYTTVTSNANLTVSSSGVVKTTGGHLAATTYTVSGTDTDTLGDTGTWTYTLTVSPSTITQSAPTAGTTTVGTSSTFTDQLKPPTYDGATISYVTKVSNAHLAVSSSGAIATVGAPLAVTTYTVSGTDTDTLGDTGTWTYTLTVNPSVITQIAPTLNATTVDGSSSFTDQLGPQTANGSTVNYVTTSSNANIAVSASGAVSVTGGTLPVNTYTVSGTDSDALGDAGTWTYSLTVTPSTITQDGLTKDTTSVDGSSAYQARMTAIGNHGGDTTFVANGGDTTDFHVNSAGVVTTGNFLKVGDYTVSGTLGDPDGDTGNWTFALSVTASAIPQTAPLTGSTTVDGSPTFTDALAPLTNHNAAVSYTTTSTNAHLLVSSSGAITTTGGYLAASTYTVSGTDTDALGDTGTWTYTLTVNPSTITQSAPTSGSTMVDTSSGFNDQLVPATNHGSTITYVTTSTNAHLTVSPSGGIEVVNGPLAATTYTVSGTDTDTLGDTGTWTYTLTVNPGVIAQGKPLTGTVTVDDSSAFTDSMSPITDNGAAVTYVATTGSLNLKVSPSGVISTFGGPLPVNTYTLSGTDSDSLGDAGTWSYTLTVTPSTITQNGLTNDTVAVDGSAGYHGTLSASGNNGDVTFSANTGDTTDLHVSSAGAVTTGSYLKVGTYTFGGSLGDTDGDIGLWSFTLVVTASSIEQLAPLTGTTDVDSSGGFTAQLSPAQNHGATVTFVTTASNTNLTVSANGVVAVTGGPLAVGPYTVSGTDSDTLGDTGTWTYTLNVTPSTIVQAVPNGDAITVDQSTGYSDQLEPTTNHATPVSFTTTSSNANLAVSSSGALTVVSGPIKVGTYTVSGTDTDGLGDTGTWTYSLVVTASLILQVAPTSDSTSVDSSGAYSTQLSVSGNNGSPAFAATGGDTSDLHVSSTGVVTTTGMLATGAYTFSGTDTDTSGDAGTWTFSLTVTPSSISQIALTSDTTSVDGSSGYQGQLGASGNNGAATYVVTGGDSSDLHVSSAGVVTTNGFLAAGGKYAVSGTIGDGFGDTGTWTFTLTVTPSTINQNVPNGDTVTVDGSTGFTDQLSPTTNDGGGVTYVTATTNANLSVSGSGAVSVSGAPLSVGTYTVSGTDSDTLGDAGTWTYELTVTKSLITQASPTGSSIDVDGSATATDQLAVTGNNGTVSFVATGGDTVDLSVSSSGAVTTNGLVSAGTHTFSGTDSDTSGDAGVWSYTLTVAPSTITQIGLTNDTSSVDGSSGYGAQLSASGNNGTVSYSSTSGDTTDLKVSTSGAVTTKGYLASGTYTVGGTLSDAAGDTGTWTYTLVVTGSTISQSAPTSATITISQSSGFADSLAPSSHDGAAVMYATTVTNANLAVSTTGGLTVVGAPLTAGDYTVSGTLSDSLGDTGTWTYTLTVLPAPAGGGGGGSGGGGGGGGGTTLKTQATLTLTSLEGQQGTPYQLTSSGGSGTGAVNYAVTNAGSANCSITGSTLNATAGGSCTVTVTKAADATYAVASSAPTSVTIDPAETTIPVNPPPAPMKPTPVTLTFAKGSTSLTLGDKSKLITLAHKLVSGASIRITYYSKGQVSLAKLRAQAVETYLKKIHAGAVNYSFQMKSTPKSDHVVVTTTKN